VHGARVVLEVSIAVVQWSGWPNVISARKANYRNMP
jgi:hypothetical protein